LWAALVELRSVHLHLEPVGHLLVGNGFGVGVAGDAERGDEKRGLRDGAVAMIDRDGGASPVQEQFPPTAIQFAEAAVAIAVRMLLAIFLPQQFDSQIAVLLQLLADVDKIGLTPQRSFRRRLARREKRLFQAALIPFFVERPAQAKAGDVLIIYCSGLGMVDQPIADGGAAPFGPPAKVVNTVTVNIGGMNAQASISTARSFRS
jgi:hypothetical protein